MKAIQPIFVEYIPEILEDGKLYLSEKYCIAIHLCPCGCGEKIATPLVGSGNQREWELIKNGDLISLTPSIGNGYLPCRSHYYITNNEIIIV